ncbi:MAG: DUF6504 family protein [Phycisphaerales bacterium]
MPDERDGTSRVFVSEPITPESGSFRPEALATGLTSAPASFVWRGRRFEVRRVIEETKRSGRERGRSDGELYLRRQEFLVEVDGGAVATIYFERTRARGDRSGRSRWFIYDASTGMVDQTRRDRSFESKSGD